MKLNKYSWLAALPMIFTACQNDALVEDQQQNDGFYSLNCTIGQEAADSRAQIILGNTVVEQEFFRWNAGDAFTLYLNDNKKLKPVTFTISSDYSNDALSSSANFFASEAIPMGTYKAVYPTTVTLNADEEYERVALEQQKNLDFSSGTVEEVWRDYFSKNMLMRATVVLTEGGAESVKFQHECALARITYKNESGKDQPIGGVSLGGNQQFGHIKTLNVIGGWDSGASSNDYPIFIKNLTVKDGDTFDFYVLFFPCGFADGEMHLNMNTSGNWMSPLTLPLSTIAAANNGSTSFVGGKRYWFNVTQKPEGLAWTKDLSGDVVTIKNTELSQALYGVLGADKVSLNDDNYAVMNKTDVDAVTALDFNAKGYTITSLAGIENFVNLDDLRCNSVGLVTCDLSKNKALKVLMLSSNPLEGVLDLSNNANLEVLYLQGTDKLTTVKLDKCTKLGFVCLTTTRSLTSFDIPNKAGVYFLDYSSSSLNFNLSEFTGLTTLKCSFKGLTELNLSDEAKSKLTFIECSGNNLGDLDLSGYTSLETFSGFNAGLTSLNVSEAVNLKKLWCFQNNMQSLDITSLSNLEEVRCGNQLNDAVLLLNLTETQKTNWDTTWSTDVYNINVNLKVQTLVTINNAQLSSVLYSIFGASNVKLENGNAVMTKSFAESVVELNLYNKSLTSLDGIGVFKNLAVLNCEENALTTLDLSQLSKLKNLNCVSNKLTALDLSNCPELTNLRCAKNQLTGISVNHLKNLVELDIIRNKLTSLDVSKLTKLKGLCCQGNMLKTLDLTNCTSLKGLQCGEQTDFNGKQIPLELKLADNLLDLWETQWKLDGSNADVILYTGSSVESGNGNTGGSDFTIEGIY